MRAKTASTDSSSFPPPPDSLQTLSPLPHSQGNSQENEHNSTGYQNESKGKAPVRSELDLFTPTARTAIASTLLELKSRCRNYLSVIRGSVSGSEGRNEAVWDEDNEESDARQSVVDIVQQLPDTFNDIKRIAPTRLAHSIGSVNAHDFLSSASFFETLDPDTAWYCFHDAAGDWEATLKDIATDLQLTITSNWLGDPAESPGIPDADVELSRRLGEEVNIWRRAWMWRFQDVSLSYRGAQAMVCLYPNGEKFPEDINSRELGKSKLRWLTRKLNLVSRETRLQELKSQDSRGNQELQEVEWDTKRGTGPSDLEERIEAHHKLQSELPTVKDEEVLACHLGIVEEDLHDKLTISPVQHSTLVASTGAQSTDVTDGLLWPERRESDDLRLSALECPQDPDRDMVLHSPRPDWAALGLEAPMPHGWPDVTHYPEGCFPTSSIARTGEGSVIMDIDAYQETQGVNSLDTWDQERFHHASGQTGDSMMAERRPISEQLSQLKGHCKSYTNAMRAFHAAAESQTSGPNTLQKLEELHAQEIGLQTLAEGMPIEFHEALYPITTIAPYISDSEFDPNEIGTPQELVQRMEERFRWEILLSECRSVKWLTSDMRLPKKEKLSRSDPHLETAQLYSSSVEWPLKHATMSHALAGVLAAELEPANIPREGWPWNTNVSSRTKQCKM